MIYVEDQSIKLGEVILPGVVKSIEVTETAKVDEQEVEGSSVKPKQATGYEDAKITVELIVDDTPAADKYQRYATLRTLFRQNGQNVPQPMRMVCAATAAHGIDKVIFKQLSHKEESKRDQLTATLELWEYIPQTITATKKSSSSSGSGKNSSSSKTTSTSSSQRNLNEDYEEYLEKDRGRSPAADDASPGGKAMNRIDRVNMLN